MSVDYSPQALRRLALDTQSTGRAKLRAKLLISVRGPEEVEATIAGGADWIDLKEPMAGALGAVSVDIARQVVDCVGGRLPISAALGELAEWDDSPARGLLGLTAIEVVKLGLSGCARLDDWQASWKAAAETIGESCHELAAVAYADWHRAAAPPPEEVIAVARSVGCRYFLIDTFDKKMGALFAHLSVSELRKTLQLAREASLKTVVAGSLQRDDLATLTLMETDIIGVRGSVCGGDRTAKVDPQLVADFRAALV